MARKMTEWPSKQGPISKIMPSDGCKGDTVPLAVDQWYDSHEFGCHLGNVGVEQRIDWELLRRIADEGWEFGLHAPINAKEDLDEFLWGKGFIEERLDRPMFGVRHHYWSIDWRQPHLTYRKHVNAGFRYDMSIAWRDIPGFRAGTTLPYRPFDPDRNEALDLYVVPTAIMDGHVISGPDGENQAIESIADVVDKVRQAGGILVLDWHTEVACNAERREMRGRPHVPPQRKVKKRLLE
jgi:hypothetical protein